MNAELTLRKIALALEEARLEAILIGAAGAALQGAPITTDDFDFMFRPTPANMKKIARVAAILHAGSSQPFYPVSPLIRLEGPAGLQVDFMPHVAGIGSFESLRSRSCVMSIDDWKMRVADLGDIIKSKRAAGRPKDLAVLPVLEATRREQKSSR